MLLGAVAGLGVEADDRGVERLLAAVEVLDVVDEAPLVLEDLLGAAALGLAQRVVTGGVDRVVDGVVGDGLG